LAEIELVIEPLTVPGISIELLLTSTEPLDMVTEPPHIIELQNIMKGITIGLDVVGKNYMPLIRENPRRRPEEKPFDKTSSKSK